MTYLTLFKIFQKLFYIYIANVTVVTGFVTDVIILTITVKITIDV